MRGWFEVKVRATLGPDDGDDKEVTILGRTVCWKPWGIEYEADQRHAEIIVNQMAGETKGKETSVEEVMQKVLQVRKLLIY